VSRFDFTFEPKGFVARRIEVIADGGRRRWSQVEKDLAVETSLAPDAVISHLRSRSDMVRRGSNCSLGGA